MPGASTKAQKKKRAVEPRASQYCELLKLLQEAFQTIHAGLDVFRRDRIAQAHKIRCAEAAARHDRDQALFQQQLCKIITAADDLTCLL